MRLTIKIDLSGEVFQPDPTPEVARILQVLSRKIEFVGLKQVAKVAGTVYDVNMTPAGTIRLRTPQNKTTQTKVA